MRNEKLIKAKNQRRRNAINILEKQLMRGTKPAKGGKPIVIVNGNYERLNDIPLYEYEKENIASTVQAIERKISRSLR